MDSNKDKSRIIPEKNQLSVPELLQGKCFREEESTEKKPQQDPRIKSPDEFLINAQAPLPPHFNAVDFKLEEFAKVYLREKELWIRYHERVNKWKNQARTTFRQMQQEIMKVRLYKAEIIKLQTLIRKKDREIARLKNELPPHKNASNF